MNEFMNMDISEKISCFIDGELPTEETGNLFFEIASKPDYQEELRSMLIIKNSLKNNMGVAPPHLKNNVLKRTVNRKPSNPINYYAGIVSSFIMSNIGYFATGLAVISIVGMLLFNNNSENEKQNVANQLANTSNSNAIIPSNNLSNTEKIELNNIDLIENDISNNKSIITEQNNKTNYSKKSNINASKPKLNDTYTFQEANDIVLNDNANSEKNTLNITDSYIDENNYSLNQRNQQKIENIKNNQKISRFLNKLTISLKTFDGTSTPDFKIGNKQTTLLNNFSFGINYNFDYNHNAGIVFGFENFLMDYNRIENEVLYNYNQNYNTQWVGINYNYIFDEIANTGIRPNLNMLVGGTKIGPIGKIGAGLTYHLNEFLSITGGIETGWLFYTNNGDIINGKWFSTHKLGYNFGINFGL